MIYTYQYIDHPICGFHKKVSYFFEKLIELDLSEYKEDQLFEKDFTPCVSASYKLLKGNFKEIHKLYHQLTPEQKATVKRAFEANKDIEKACKDTTILPVKYDEIDFFTVEKEDEKKDKKKKKVNILKEFFMALWNSYPLNDTIEATYKTVQDHYNAFIVIDKHIGQVCPFCGLELLKPPTESSSIKKRPAYDHIAAESLYPFVSVNFRNLVPACHECNSDEKKATDVFYKNGKRRPVLYPYDNDYNEEELSIVIQPTKPYHPETKKMRLTETEWDLLITLAGKEEPYLTTWDEVYHIRERYKRRLRTFESTWESVLIKAYQREMKDKVSYERYKDKILEATKDEIKSAPVYILKYIYYNYMLSQDAFRKYLEDHHKTA